MNELYDAIPHRHTNRFPFEAQKALPQDFVETLSRVANEDPDVRLFLFTADDDRKRVVEVLGKGAAELNSYPDMFHGKRTRQIGS